MPRRKPMPDATLFHPEVVYLTDDSSFGPMKCPECGNVADLDDYDCIGADLNCVFCNQCNTELRL